jgi:RNA polymerase sigma-70 factor (family 1)
MDIMNFDTLFKTYYRPLCIYAMHYLSGNIEEAEDIVQECFVKIWQQHANTSKAYLYATVRNMCIDCLRENKPTTVELHPQDLDGYITDPEAQDRSFREAELWTAIDSLPEKCRQIFLMNKRDGMKYQEIAEELNLSEKTVEHQISKALKRLKGHKKHLAYIVFYLG